MPVPTAYTEAQLRSYLVTTLTSVSTYLGWDTSSAELQEAVIDTALALGVSDVATATDMAQMRAVGAVMILRRARVAAAPRYDVTEDQQQHNRSQAYKALGEALAEAERQAMPYLSEYRVGVDTLRYPSADPYAYYPDEDRVL